MEWIVIKEKLMTFIIIYVEIIIFGVIMFNVDNCRIRKCPMGKLHLFIVATLQLNLIIGLCQKLFDVRSSKDAQSYNCTACSATLSLSLSLSLSLN